MYFVDLCPGKVFNSFEVMGFLSSIDDIRFVKVQPTRKHREYSKYSNDLFVCKKKYK